MSGTLRPVLSGHLASLLVTDAGGTWVVLTADEFTARELESVDPTRRVAEVTVPDAVIPTSRQLPDLSTMAVVGLAGVLFAADAVAGRSGAWTPHPSTRRTAGSSAGRSVSSRA